MLRRLLKLLRSNLHYFLLSLFILLLFALLIFGAAYYRQKQIAMAHTFSARQTELLGQMLAFSVGAGLHEGNYELVNTAFTWAKQDPSIVFISIVDEADVPIVEHNPTKLAIDIKPYLKTDLTKEVDKGFVVSSTSILFKNITYGSVVIVYSLSSIDEGFRMQKVISIVILLFLLGGGTWLIVKYSRMRRYHQSQEIINEQRLTKINTCFLTFETDPYQNIKRLTSLAGELLDAECVFYNRYDKGRFYTVGFMRAKEMETAAINSEYSLLHKSVDHSLDDVVFVRHLQEGPLRDALPVVLRHRINTYAGKSVAIDPENLGTLSVLFERDVKLGTAEVEILGILLSAIIVEEDRRRAEDVLRRSEEKFHHLFENSQDALMILEPPLWRFTAGNQATLKMFGAKNQQEFVSYGHWELSPEFQRDGRASAERSKEMIERALRAGSHFFEWTHRQVGGEEFPADVLLTRIEQNGKIVLQASVRDITERKHAEEARRANEDRLRRAQTIAHVGNWELDLSSQTMWASEESFRIYGLERTSECLPLNLVQECVLPEYRERLDLALDDLKSNNCPYDQEFMIKRFDDGQLSFIHSWAELTFDQNGAPIKLTGVLQDITERKRSENVLRESEERFRKAFEEGPVGIATAGFTDGRFTSVNEAFCKMLGYTEEELKQLTFVDVTHPDYRTRDMEAVKQMQLGETQKHTTEKQYLRKDGDAIWGTQAMARITGSDGRSYALSVIQDISERKKAGDLLVASENRLRLATKAGGIGVWDWDILNNELTWDESMYDLHGLCKQDFGGAFEAWTRTLHPEDRQHTEGEIEAAIRGEREYAPEFRIIRPDGVVRIIKAESQTIRDEDGKAVRMIGTNIDITEMRAIEDRLRQSQKMDAIGQLAGGIAHDFNNVLVGIVGYTEMSLQHVQSNPALERNLHKVLEASDRAAQLIKQILTFSRQGGSQKSVTEIRPIVKEVLGLLKASIPSSVIIESDLQKDAKPVLADAIKMHEMLLNLATNAVYAMNRKGILTIRLFAEHLDHVEYGRIGEITPGEYSIIEVADTGCGMDAKTLSKAFDPFFTTKGVGEGTGMGLSVVLGVVQSHGGNIRVESAVGKGTSFKIYLPVTRSSANGVKDNGPKADVSGSERILFVDDEQMVLETAKTLLTNLGYQVNCVSGSHEALAFMREHGADIDILVTDQTMPGMTGMELAKEALKIRRDLPVIICTGYSNEINSERAEAVGINQIVFKPYGAYEIGRALRTALDKGA